MSIKLIDKLPSFYDNGNIVPEIQNSMDNEKNILESEIRDFINQIFVETATWGLDLWEEFLNIPIDENLDLNLRRSRIKTKITRSTPALTKNQLKTILKPYFENVDIIELAKENRFEAIFGTRTVVGENLSIAINEIEESKPAHLAYLVGINYITKVIISKVFKRWQSDVIPLCGTIDCSYNEYVSTSGKKLSSGTYSNILTAFSEAFIISSEETVILGSGKRLSEGIDLVINKFNSEEFVKVAEDLYLNNSDGKTMREIIINEIDNLFSEEILKVSESSYVGEVN